MTNTSQAEATTNLNEFDLRHPRLTASLGTTVSLCTELYVPWKCSWGCINLPTTLGMTKDLEVHEADCGNRRGTIRRDMSPDIDILVSSRSSTSPDSLT